MRQQTTTGKNHLLYRNRSVAVSFWTAFVLLSQTIPASVAAVSQDLEVTPEAVIAFKNFLSLEDSSFVVNSVGSKILDFGAGLENSAPAQAFVARRGGHVTSIATVIRRNRSFFDEPLIVEVRESVSGLPGDLIGSVTVPAESIPTSEELVTFDFTDLSIELVNGESYFTVFRVLDPPEIGWERSGHYRIRTFDLNALSVGQRAIWSSTGGAPPWTSSQIRPHEIGLVVTVVPEPASSILILLGGITAIFPRRIFNSSLAC